MLDKEKKMNANGLVFFGHPIPVELVCEILKFVDPTTLVFSCRLVCKEWTSIVDDLVWEAKTNCSKRLIGRGYSRQVPWWVAYWVSKKQLFSRNLLKNTCGENKLVCWENEGFLAADGWKVEKKPIGSPPLPPSPDFNKKLSCFSSSYAWNSKYQLVRLAELGLTNKIMDEIRPDFEFSEWICSRFDCGGEYRLEVSLLNEDQDLIEHSTVIEPRKLESSSEWVKVKIFLKGNYEAGARYLKFLHRGKDTQFWKGHYGIKISGSVARPVFPSEQFKLSDKNSTNSELMH